MKRIITVLLITSLLVSSVYGCGKRKESTNTSSDAVTAAPNAIESTPEPTPSILYDAGTRTVTVEGTHDYAALSLPEEVKNARMLEVHDNEFILSIFLPALRTKGWDEQTELPGLIDRTDRSLRFLRQYLCKNAGEAYPEALAERSVSVSIKKSGFGYRINESQISLVYNDAGMHREFLYLLAMINSSAVGWEQIGYAWYVGTCIDPYSEVMDAIAVVPEMPYYSQCIAGGIDPEHMSASDIRIVYDACARVCFEKGLTHWGSYCESMPVSSESVYTRSDAMQQGDTQMSAFMAASFLAWLDDEYGFEKLSLFCFGQNSFEEAFETDFQSAFDEWSTWIKQTYPSE